MRAGRSRSAIAAAALAVAAAAGTLLAPPPLRAQSAAQPQVTVYRCVGADGGVSLRDTPCPKGERQEARTMVRPTDAPPSRPTPESASAPGSGDGASAAARPVPRIVVVREPAPAPMYECTTPDNTTYTSDSPEGNPRWVPLWTLGYPMVPLTRRGIDSSTGLSITDGNVHIDGNHTVLTPPVAVPRYAYGAGTWVRDDCHELPPQEVCARLRDRRDEIRTRFFNAMPSERDVLRVEERGVNARLDNDCGGH